MFSDEELFLISSPSSSSCEDVWEGEGEDSLSLKVHLPLRKVRKHCKVVRWQERNWNKEEAQREDLEEELERERLATEAERRKLEEEARIEELMASRPSYVQQEKRNGDSGGWGGKWRGNKKRKDDWRKGKRR